MKLKKAFLDRRDPFLNTSSVESEESRQRFRSCEFDSHCLSRESDEDEDEGAGQNQPVYRGDDGSELGD